jgi:ABC-2 type transport system permease protein
MAERAGMLLPAASLWLREIRSFLRQPSRITGAIGAPLLFWVFLGGGLSASFRSPATGEDYMAFFLPGSMVMMILFTAVFATISIIEDRKEGFMQGVLVSPAPRSAIALGKILGGATLAVMQALVFVALLPFAGKAPGAAAVAAAMAASFVLAFALTSFGFFFAWRARSVQGFHAVMNLVLFPLWLLSGAVFPADGAPAWLRLPMHLNPLSYGVAAVREGMHMSTPGMFSPQKFATAMALTAVFGAAMFALCVRRVAGAPHDASP